MKQFLMLFFALLALSCSGISREQAQEDLAKLADSDLSVIVSGLDSSVVMDKPFHKLIKIKWFEKSKYSCDAEIHYFFLKDSSFRIERKYRLNLVSEKWERYTNEYKLIEK